MESNYPAGAAYDSKAPWNEPLERKPVEITACASNTLHKSANINVTDYNIGDDGEQYFEECNLAQAWEEQEYTAKEALDLAAEFAQKVQLIAKGNGTSGLEKEAAKVFNACKNWIEDEFEVVLD